MQNLVLQTLVGVKPYFLPTTRREVTKEAVERGKERNASKLRRLVEYLETGRPGGDERKRGEARRGLGRRVAKRANSGAAVLQNPLLPPSLDGWMKCIRVTFIVLADVMPP